MSETYVLVVDDSVVVRTLVAGVLGQAPGIRVEVARHGRAALEMIARKVPDLVVLDIEMPVLDGLSTLRELRKLHPRLPVIMFSTLTERGATITLDALAAGASDYLTKPVGAAGLEAAREHIRVELLARIQALCGPAMPGASSATAATRAPAPLPRQGQRPGNARVDLVAIGTSTGGPNALGELLPRLPGDLAVPVVVVQHMPELFTKMLARSLDAKCALSVAEGQAGAELQAGQVWIAPGGQHMTVARGQGVARLALNQEPPECSCRPAVDVLFRSVAKSYGANALAVVLTGMGNDGCVGSTHVHDAGGRVLVQDEASSVVWGMPGSVHRAGLADATLPLASLADEIQRRVALGRHGATSTGPAGRRQLS